MNGGVDYFPRAVARPRMPRTAKPAAEAVFPAELVRQEDPEGHSDQQDADHEAVLSHPGTFFILETHSPSGYFWAWNQRCSWARR